MYSTILDYAELSSKEASLFFLESTNLSNIVLLAPTADLHLPIKMPVTLHCHLAVPTTYASRTTRLPCSDSDDLGIQLKSFSH